MSLSAVLSIKFYILIFFSETTGSIGTKPDRNVHRMVPYNFCCCWSECVKRACPYIKLQIIYGSFVFGGTWTTTDITGYDLKGVKRRELKKKFIQFWCIFFLQSVHLYELLIGHKNVYYFISKKGLKGSRIPKFRIFERYIEFLFFIEFWSGFVCLLLNGLCSDFQ